MKWIGTIIIISIIHIQSISYSFNDVNDGWGIFETETYCILEDIIKLPLMLWNFVVLMMMREEGG